MILFEKDELKISDNIQVIENDFVQIEVEEKIILYVMILIDIAEFEFVHWINELFHVRFVLMAN
jgi:hypothetical protein